MVLFVHMHADGVENNAILQEALREHEISEQLQGASRYIHVHMFYY